MSRAKKIALSIAVIAVMCVLSSLATLAAFTATAENSGNSVSSGTVDLSDNDSGTAMYSMSAAKPGDSVTKCIKVRYDGSLDADVRLYTPSTIGALGQYVNLRIEPGTQPGTPSAGSCTGYSPDGGDLFNAALDTLPASYATGLADYPGSTTKWANGNSVSYRITATLSASAPDAAQGQTTSSHVLRWEAHNQ
jgi:predicted ribosomally synthesized peptide with SipW-like signal peptide